MRHPTRWGSVTLAIVVLLLTGCTGQEGLTPRLLTADVVNALSCADVESVQEIIEEGNGAPADSGKHRALSAWIGDREVADVQTELETRAQTCASDSTASSPPLSKMPIPDVKSWSDIVDHVEVGERVGAHASALGFTWDDASAWSELRDDEERLIPARIVLSFDDVDAKAAREAAGVDDDVPVVRIASCTDVDGEGCRSNGVALALTPIEAKGEEIWLRPGAGVLLTEGAPFVTYTWEQVK